MYGEETEPVKAHGSPEVPQETRKEQDSNSDLSPFLLSRSGLSRKKHEEGKVWDSGHWLGKHRSGAEERAG